MVDLFVAFAEVFAGFAVANNRVGHTVLEQHRRGDFSGVGTVPFPMHVLTRKFEF